MQPGKIFQINPKRLAFVGPRPSHHAITLHNKNNICRAIKIFLSQQVEIETKEETADQVHTDNGCSHKVGAGDKYNINSAVVDIKLHSRSGSARW